MPIEIAYGKDHLPVQLPDGAQTTIIRKITPPKLKDPRRAMGFPASACC